MTVGILLVTAELFVTISVSYYPPPGVVLGPNEYRAASGPLMVTCTAIGGTGSVSYQWSSNCRACPFRTTTEREIWRVAVYSGDSGTHTCTATTTEADGSASIPFIIKGKRTDIKAKGYFAILRQHNTVQNRFQRQQGH